MKHFILLTILTFLNTLAFCQEDEYEFNYDTVTYAIGVELGYGFTSPEQFIHPSEFFYYSNGAGKTAQIDFVNRFSYRRMFIVASVGLGLSHTEQTYVIGTLKDLSIGHTFTQKTQNLLGSLSIGRKFKMNENTDFNLGIGLDIFSENFGFRKTLSGTINSFNSKIDNNLEGDEIYDATPENYIDMTYNYELKISQPFQVAPTFLVGIESKLKKGSILLACDFSINNIAYSTVVKYSGNDYSAFANTKYVASTFGVNLTYYFR